MSVGMLSPAPVIKAYLDSLVDASTGRRSRGAIGVLYGVPVVAALLILRFDLALKGTFAQGLITTAGLIAVLLFGMAVQVADRAGTWADTHPPYGARTVRHARVLKELMATASYASMASIGATLALVVSSVAEQPRVQAISSAAAAGLLVHTSIVLVLVMRRSFLYAVKRLDAAQTGADAPVPPRDPATSGTAGWPTD